MKFPFMTRRMHDKIMAHKAASFYKQRQLDKKHYEDRAHKIRTELRRVLDKMTTVNISHLVFKPNTWRMVFDFDPRPILFSLERGDDKFMIDVIGEELKYKVVKELTSLNIQRPEKFGLER